MDYSVLFCFLEWEFLASLLIPSCLCVHFRPQVCFFFREKNSISSELKNGPGFLLAPNAVLYFLNKGAFLRSPDSAWNSYLFHFIAKPSISHSPASFSIAVTTVLRSVFSDWLALSLSWVLRHPDVPLQPRALRLPAHPPEAPSDSARGCWQSHPRADRSNEWVTHEPGDGSCPTTTVTAPATSPLSQDWNLTAISLPWLFICSFILERFLRKIWIWLSPYPQGASCPGGELGTQLHYTQS